MKKITSLILIFTILMVGLAGCGVNEEEAVQPEGTENVENDNNEEVEQQSIHVIAPNGTPTLSMVKMFEENPKIAENVDVTYESIAATDVLSSKLISKEADIAIVPTNLAANLYNKGVPYKLAGSSVWGILYLVSSEEVSNWEDLKGKEISMIGRGLTPDAIFRYVLTENGIGPDTDLSLKYFSGGSELATSFISGQGDYALIPEPLLTKVLMKRKDAKVVADLQEEWSNVTGIESYPQASIIVSNELVENSPEVVDSFLNEYEKAVAWNNENPLKAGEYYENLNIGLNAKIINKALEGCNIRYVGAADAKDALDEYLKVLYEFNPKLLGEKLPDEGLYLEK